MGGCCANGAVKINHNSDHPLYDKTPSRNGKYSNNRNKVLPSPNGYDIIQEKSLKKRSSICMEDAIMIAYEYREWGYLQPNSNKSAKTKSKIMSMKPTQGVLCVLDKIFDYLDIEEIEAVSTGCKLFLYVATLDSIMLKYKHIPTFSSKKVLQIVEDHFLDNQRTRKGSEDVDQTLSSVHCLKVIKHQRDNGKEQRDRASKFNKNKTPESLTSLVPEKESKRESKSTHSFNSPWTTNSKNVHRFEKSPPIGDKGSNNKNKSIIQQMMYMKNVMEAQKEKTKDSFMNTVVFSDGMGEVYTDADHLNNCLKSLSSEEFNKVADMNNPNNMSHLQSPTCTPPLGSVQTRRNSPAVPLDAWIVSKLIGDEKSSLRRLTKKSFIGREKISIPQINPNRPSMFHPYQLG